MGCPQKQLQESFKQCSLDQQLKIKFTEHCPSIRDSYFEETSLEKKQEVLSLFKTEILARPGHYTLATSVYAEIQSKHNYLIASELVDKNLSTIEQTSA